MLKYLQLPLYFDAAQMQEEAAALAEEYWKLHYNTMNYSGGWSALPLYAMNGSIEAIHAIHNSNHVEYLPTPLLQRCPYTASVLEQLQFPKQAVRLMRLEAGAIIKEHSDHQLAFEEGEVRLHIPVQTNEFVEFYVQNERIIMGEGELWYLNLSLPHRVSNLGQQDRIHLVIDGVVNDWLREQFARPDLTVRSELQEETPQYDAQTRRLMIQHLRNLGTETAMELIAQLEEMKEDE